MLVSRRAVIAGPLLGLFATRSRAETTEGSHVPQTPSPLAGLAGSFLISPPGQDSGPFGRSVVFLLHRDAGGAMGVIVNKPVLRDSLAQLLDAIGDRPRSNAPPQTDITIYFGGPVEPDALLVVHSRDFATGKTKPISALAAVSPADSVLRALADGKGPRQFLFLSGYAGWAPGQLESEIGKEWWIIVPAEGDILFGSSDSTKWQRAYDRRPVDL